METTTKDDLQHLTRPSASRLEINDMIRSFGDKIQRKLTNPVVSHTLHPSQPGSPSLSRHDFDLKTKELNDPSYQPTMTQDVPMPRLSKLREKFSSTATIFMNSTQSVLSPNVSEILKCLSVCLYWKMKKNESVENPVLMDIFEEDKYPLGYANELESYSYSRRTPDIEQVNSFLKSIYDTEELSAESAVMALIFIERLIALTNITLNGSNWRRICFGAIIVANKIWEDTAVWNSDFKSVFPKLQLSDLGKLEREFLRQLDFNVAIKSSIYVKYYFSLRTIAERNEINFPLQPLTKMQEQTLEAKSSGMESKVKQFSLRRGQSLESYVPKDAPVGIDDMKLSGINNVDS